MATRHDIISITFQANAGKANVALKALQTEAQKSSDRVKDLKKQLEDGLRANLPRDQIQKIQSDIKSAEKEVKQWNAAYKELTKGVRTLDEAIKAFNGGTMSQMSAAFNKAAANAAKLAQTKMTPGTQEWKEMDALIVEAQSNVLKANTAINDLTATIKKGGTASKSTLTQAKSDLQQLLTLEVRGSTEWNTYNKQLKVVEGELLKIAQAEQRAAQADQTAAMAKRMKNLKTESSAGLAELRRYWETMVAGAAKGSKELATYESKLKQVVNQERKRATASAEQVIGSPNKFGVEQIRNAVQEMTKLRDSVQQGIPAWQHYNKLVKQGEAYLQEYTEREKIARGEAVSLADALKIASTAGGKGFTGTAQQLQQAEAALQKALATAKKGSPEWAKYREALAKVRVEMQNAGMTSERMRDILAKPANAKNLNELQAAVKRAKAELDLMAGTVGKNNKAYTQLAEQTKKAEIQMKSMQAQSHGTATAFEKAWSRLKTYVGLYVGAAVAMQKLVGTLGDLMELSDKMGEVRKTTGFTAEEVGRLSENLKKLDVRTSLTSLMEVSAKAGQLGLKTEEDILGFTEAANKLMIALPEMGTEAATEMMKVAMATGEVDKIRKQMQEGLIEGSSATAVALEKVGSTIDQLRANSASAAPAITDFVKRVGAVGAQSGISIDQIAALGSTVDALGMRVEMSATALSRMIPAIKNNAFDVAKAIGVTPNTLRNLFDTGRGMEAILMIFQHIKDQNMDEESIESMLGLGNMKEIMKELNQMGARAGIVFGGLSQNVDELRRQLGIAATAYEENIAIQNEFNKMNETTAAKWARLKNQFEEFFVGDRSQRFLGGIIDMLRWIVDMLTGDSGISSAIRKVIVVISVFKINLGVAIADIIKKVGSLGASFKNLGKTIWSLNGLWNGLATIGIFAVMKIIETVTAVKDASKAVGDLEGEVRKQTKAVDDLFYATNKTNNALSEAKTRLEEAARAGGDTAEAEKQLAKANAAHVQSIRDINSKYGQYLGYMLSETASAEQLARARELINAKLRETITLKQKEAALGNIEQEYGGKANKALGKLDDTIQAWIKDPQEAARIYTRIVEAVQRFGTDAEGLRREIDQKILPKGGLGRRRSGTTWSILDVAEEYRKEIEKMQKEEKQVNARFDAQEGINRQNTREATVRTMNQTLADWRMLLKRFQSAEGEEKKKLAVEVYKQQRAYAALFANNADYFENDKRKGSFERTIKNMKTYEKSLRDVAGEAIRAIDAAERAETKITGTNYTAGGGAGATNPWGGNAPADSTDYSTWDVNELVARRHQMDKFKNILKPDTDIRAVLAEDKALMKALDNGLKEDWKEVIKWYNRERLKIQEELKSERFSTNEGHWRDEKKGGGRKNRFRESDYALAELDRYYSRRKEALEKARSEENMSEEVFNRQEELLEQEHLERRSKLRGTFTGEVSQEETKAFRKWWSDLEKMDELDHVPWDTVESEWSKAIASEIGRNNLNMQKDITQIATITMKHVNQIAKIIAKERPYDGITENLQDNLTKLDILFADMGTITKQQLEDGSLSREMSRRLSFLLDETEHAYTLTVEQLDKDMREKGFTAWANALAGENGDELKRQMLAQLQTAYDAVQEAIKKEASLIKKQAEIQWNDTTLPGGQSQKQVFERTLSALGLKEDQVKRANSLIGAGYASERVADKLAIKQMQIRLAMQEQYYNLIRKTGLERIAQLEKQGKMEDAEHLRKSLDLSLSEEQKKLDEQRVAIANQLEESQNRLYTELKSWSELISSSLQSVVDASHTGDKEYYNELAKLRLTGKGGPGAGRYIVIDNEGTSDAAAHYESLNEREALERQHEIERQNAMADAWKKVMDDINMKLSETITDQLNAMLQNQSIDANTQAVLANTAALQALTEGLSGGSGGGHDTLGGFMQTLASSAGDGIGTNEPGSSSYKPVIDVGLPIQEGILPESYQVGGSSSGLDYIGGLAEELSTVAQVSLSTYADSSEELKKKVSENLKDIERETKTSNEKIEKSTSSAFAKMTQAANLYGIAYQVMSNDNMSAAQKFGMVAVQAAGNAAITALTVNLSETTAQTASDTPSVYSKLYKQLGWGAIPVFALFTGILGGLMGLAASKIAKSKSQIAQATGVSASAGRLTTGMLTYAEGNVNEFTDPATLTPGRQYNVDAADGRTYRARYMGKGAKTHITNGPEFHLVGERGREAVIDAKTTRNIRMNEPEIWRSIQTLYNGGSLSHVPRRLGRGVAAYADGNLDEMSDMGMMGGMGNSVGISVEMAASLQASIDRQSDLLERAITDGIKGVFDVYGKGGLVDSYDTGKKTLNRHGQRY